MHHADLIGLAHNCMGVGCGMLAIVLPGRAVTEWLRLSGHPHAKHLPTVADKPVVPVGLDADCSTFPATFPARRTRIRRAPPLDHLRTPVQFDLFGISR
jgi:hypothetical protein